MIGKLFYGLIAALALAATAFGQSQNATLNGTVTDASGAIVPNATVTATLTVRQLPITVRSDAEGRYSFANLETGTYDLSITAPGFRSYVQHGIELLANQTLRADATLQVGDASTKVEVTAEATQLNVDNGVKQESVLPSVVNQLPLEVSAGTIRNAVQFLTFLPGVNTGTSPQAFNARINGGLKMGDEAVMDGVSMQEGTMSQSGMVSFYDFPTTPDMVTEVRVLTSSYEPEYGVTTGGEIMVTTRSGTDRFHGGVFEYFRNRDLNALQFTNARTAGDLRPKDNENSFGGFIGGPVKLPFLPFIWGSKHKTYFFHDEEYLRSLGGTNRPLVSIPSTQERTGDFSDLLALANPIQIYNPKTQTINGGTVTRTPYANNKIPTSDISTLATQWMSYLPTPTSSGPFNNYLEQPVSDGILSNLAEYLYKIDYYWSEKDHFFATIWRQKTSPNNQCALPVQLCTTSPANPEDAWVNRFNWDHTFTPSLLSHFAYGYVNRNEGYGSVPGQKALPQIPNAVAYTASPQASFSGLGLSNYATWGNVDGPGYLNKTTRPSNIANELITWVRGSHTLKFGGEYRHLQQVFRSNGNQSGSLSFNALSTAAQGSASGDPFASFAIGAVDSANMNVYNVSRYGAEQLAWNFHVGDTWRVNSKLTFNYGLRWDKFTPTFETSDKLAFFSFAANPGAGGLPGSVAYAGNSWGAASAGVRYPETPFNGGIGPRLGLAYRLGDKTVVRAGYGVFYTQAFYPGWGGGMSLDGFNPAINFGDSISGYVPSFYMDNGFPAYSKASNITASVDNGGNGPNYRPTYANHLSYTQQWNLTVERKFGNSILTVAYVGNKGTHLPSQLQPLNVLNPSLLSSLGAAALNSVFTANTASLYGVSQPYSGWAAQLLRVGTCAPTVAQALVEFPQYCGGLFGENENEGTSIYNSMQLAYQRNFSNGLYLSANYTLSRLTTDASSTTQATAAYGGIGAVINPYQGSRNYALSPDDQTHVVSFMAVYDLPFGPGKKWLNGHNSAVGHVLGGWKLSSSIKMTSGMPLYFRDSAVCGLPAQMRAACIPAINGNVLLNSWKNVNVNAPVYSVSAFTPASQFNGNYLGTGPRVSSVRGSPYQDTNLSVSKEFSVKERLHFEVRAETFNIFNNHYFTCDGQAFGDCIPFNNDPSSSTFGVWNGTVSQPRNVQLVARFTF